MRVVFFFATLVSLAVACAASNGSPNAADADASDSSDSSDSNPIPCGSLTCGPGLYCLSGQIICRDVGPHPCSGDGVDRCLPRPTATTVCPYNSLLTVVVLDQAKRTLSCFGS